MTDRRPLFDDRRFTDLVEQARAELRRRLIDAGTNRPISSEEDAVLVSAALLVDQMHDRLGAISNRLRRPLLELIGLRPRGPRAAHAHLRLTFESPLTTPLDVPAGTEIGPAGVGSGGRAGSAPFTTVRAVRVIPNRVIQLRAEPTELLIGLAEPAGHTTVELTGVDGAVTGESWDGGEWQPCLHRTGPGGALWLEVGPGHVRHRLDGAEAAWLRLSGGRVSSEVRARTAEAVVLAVQAHRIVEEALGISDGTSGQRFRLRERPAVVRGQDPVIETSAGDGWLAWRPVESFEETRPGDHHVRYDVAAGEIFFPPAVTGPDGSRRATGPVPPAGALVRIRDYWTGGGGAGNVPAGALQEIDLALPGLRVENPGPARGGSDAETEAELWQRAPGLLRAGDRAVTAADHEELARRADPSLARVRCIADEQSGTVQVLLVATPPPDRRDRPSPADLQPSAATLEAVRSFLDQRRLLAARLHVMPPSYQGIEVDVEIVAAAGADPREVRDRAERALYAFLHPVTGGEDGAGWPFGEAVHESTIKKLLFPLPGVQDCVYIALSPVDPPTGARNPTQTVIPLIPTALPLSVGHRVRIIRG
ncbi:putative baseplate assembly protein [Actinoplanes sp. NPDC051343]|uniref:putative baseplate assembly protein n=1 Tax=Actinoplanes sp. NPDC051343 TaxID=3363906 RepID=UPI0037A4D89E